MIRIIYLDNQKTTKIDPRVLEEMMPFLTEKFGLPMGEFGHRVEEEALEAIEASREKIAREINADPEEVIFTFSDVDSDNLGIKGQALALGKGKILTTGIERRSVRDSCLFLSEFGYKVEEVEVGEEGRISIEDLEEKARGTKLLATHLGNHEIGTIQPIKEISDLVEDFGINFHLDASHAFLKVKIDVEKISANTISLSSHLIHGPKGISALFVREGTKIRPIISGGPREKGFTPGEISPANVVGFGKAVEIWDWKDVERMRRLRDLLIERLLEIPETYLNGPMEGRLPNNVNVSFMRVEGESVLMQADARGLIVSTGSACYSQELEPSYVILKIRKRYEFAHGSVRLSLSKWTTEEEVERASEILREVVERLREISPL